jgi:hypothetical protein
MGSNKAKRLRRKEKWRMRHEAKRAAQRARGEPPAGAYVPRPTPPPQPAPPVAPGSGVDDWRDQD